MKLMDERNLKGLLQVVKVGERVSAREALDRLIEWRTAKGGNLMYIPNVNRLATTMRVSGHFRKERVTKIDGSGERTIYLRAY